MAGLPEFFYGGQAVIEGVMMRGRQGLAIAVRGADGRIVLHEERLAPLARRFPVLRLPLLRGVAALIEATWIGIKALEYSAQQAASEEEPGAAGGAAPEKPLSAKEMGLAMALAFAVTIGLFVVVPALVVRLIQAYVASNVLLNLIEGLVKITLFLGYIGAISFMEDIRRVFQYHGAEHKAINCLEAGEPLTVANVARHSKIHKRCGTSFILFVLLISILLFSFFGRPPFLQRVLIHLALLPVVAGLSYEVIRQAGRKGAWAIFHWLSVPGMWTQLLTTREPDESQIEVAIRALQAVLAADNAAEAAPSPDAVPAAAP